MVSRRALSLAVRVGLVFLSGMGAQAAGRAGLWANLLLCVLLAAWALADLLVEAGQRAAAAERGEAPWRTAVLAREREARTLAAFLDHAPVPLLACEPSGRLGALNLAARQFFATDDLLVDPPAALVEAAARAAPGERQTLVLAAEGAPRAYALTAADLFSERETVRILALVDIQAEVQAAEAAALRELMQVLSHEIMNSLTPVTSLAHTAAEILEEVDGDGPALVQAREAAAGVAHRAQGLLRFIEAYRELARLPEPQLVETSLAGLIAEVALLFHSRWKAQGVELLVEGPPDLLIPLDRDLMVQALLNILANAAEAALGHADAPRVRLHAERPRRGRLALSVEDNGPGVELPDPNLIFRPFFTTKRTGTGVGLSLARQVVLAHGGAIAVGRGTLGGAEVRISL